MKKSIFVILLTLISFFSFSQETIIRGIYLGSNIYVKNPFTESGTGYCVYQVTVNGQITSDQINSSAFEIDLSHYDFKIGDRITITLNNKKGCTPEIINPDAIKPRSSFEVISAKVSDKGVLHWSTKGELGPLPFIVEHFRWNKWVTVGEVYGKGVPDINNYQLNVRPHSGKNIFRVKQGDYSATPRYSASITFESASKPVTFSIKSKSLVFSSSTLFELFNNYGNIVFKGFSDHIDLQELTNGKYYLNYDNKMGTFEKK